MSRKFLPRLFVAALAVSPVGLADQADSLWPPYAVVGLNSVLLEESATSRGDIAVVYAAPGPFLGPVHQLTLEAGARVEGSVVAHGIQLAAGAAVDGAIRAIMVAGHPTRQLRTDQTLRFPRPLELPVFPRFIPGQERVDVTAGTIRSIRPGSYGSLTVAGRSGAGTAVIVMEPGTYDFEQIELGPGARLECAAACEIRIENHLSAGDAAYLGPAPRKGVNTADMVVFVGGLDGQTGRWREDPPAVALADASVVEARLYVPNGTLRLGARARVTGRLVGRDVLLGRGATVVADGRPISEKEAAVARGSLLLREASEIQAVQGEVLAVRLLPGIVVAAQEFFARYGESLGVGSEDTMVELSAVTDHRGHVHRRFEQRHRGVPVCGVGYLLEEVDGRVTAATGRIIAGLDIQPTPTLTDEQALDRALANLPSRAYAWKEPGARGQRAQRPRGRLAIGSVDYALTAGSFRLVYRFRVSSVKPQASETLDVDAHTGAVVGRFGDIRRQMVSSQGDTLYYGKRSFLAEQFNQDPAQYWLRVPPGPGLPEISTLLRVSDTGDDGDFSSFVRDQNDFSYWPAPDRATAESKLPDLLYGVSVHWGVQRALAYLKDFEVQKWWSPINVVVAAHKELMPGGDDATPAYDPEEDAIYFPRTGKGAALMSLTVIGHEFAHGLQRHAIPEIVYSGESGAVAEGLADVFGILLTQKEVGTTWCDDVPVHAILYKDPGSDGSCAGGTAPCPGEQCDPTTGVCTQALPAQCLYRNHAEPKATGNPDTYLGTNYVAVSGECAVGGKCHKNATIAGHWLYILVNGKAGTNDLGKSYAVQGIGFEKASAVAVGTMLLKLWGSTTFADLRAATIQAATEEFEPKSPEVIAVANAWYAVGVGDAYDPRSYTPAGVGGVEPWPSVLTWSALPHEFDWQAQVSTSAKFDTNVRIVSADSSLIVPGAPGQFKLGTHVNLKPAAKYYWRVRAKSDVPASSGGNAAAPMGVIIPSTPSSGRKLALPHGTTTATMTVPSVIPAPPDALWGPWGNTQAFVTVAKMPLLKAPAPKASKPADTAPITLSMPGGGLEPPAAVPPPAPPVAEGAFYPWKTEFSWDAVSGAKEYRMTVSTSSVHDCDQTHLTLPTTHTVVEIVPAAKVPIHEIALRSGRTYYWWLEVMGPEGIAGGCSFAGSPVKFATSTPTTTLVSPSDGSKVSPFDIPLSWKATVGAGGYQVEIAPEESPVFSVATEPDAPGATIQVDQLGSFHWRVRPKGPLSADYGAYTAPWEFVADKSLTKPEPLYPLETHYPPYGDSFYFMWKKVAGADNYGLTIYHRNADGSAGAVLSEPTGGTPYPGSETETFYLEPPGTLAEVAGYCWKIAAIGSQGLTGADSDVTCFDLGAAQPTITYPPNGATGVEYSPSTHFSWSSAYAPKGFRFSLGYCPSYAGIFNDYSVSSQNHDAGLNANTDYCWKIIGIDPDGSDASSGSLARFTTKPEPPKPACKTFGLESIVWTSPIPAASSPSGVVITIVTRPFYLKWEQKDPAISEYRVTGFSVRETGVVSQLDNFYAASTIPQGSSKTFLVPTNIYSTEIMEFFYFSVYARAGSGCDWDYVGGVSNISIK